MNDGVKAKKFLKDQTHMVLAVTLTDGTPWAVPVKIQKYEGEEFEWDSRTDTVHSQALEIHPEMSLVTFQRDSDPFGQFGFYATGRGELVEDKGNGFAKYRFTATKAWVNDQTFVKREIEL